MLLLTYPDPRKGALYNLTPPLLFITPALLVTFRIACLLRRPRSDHSKGRPLWFTLPLSLGAVFLTAVVVFVVILWAHS